MPLTRNRRLKRFAIAALAVCATAPFPAYGAVIAQPRAGAAILLVLGAGLIVGYLLAVMAQQVGRLVACKLIGWDIYLIVVGPFLVRREPFAVRLGQIPGRTFTGWVMAAPPTPEKLTKWRQTLFNLGGVIANFICVAAATIVLVAALRNALLAFFIIPIALMSFLVAFPTRKLTYLKNSTRDHPTITRFRVAHLKGIALYASSIAPEQWDPTLVSLLEAGAALGTVEADADARSADIFLYERYFHLKDYKKARAALDRAISRIRPSERMWDGTCIEDAFFSAFVERNIQRAQEALAKVDAAKLHRFYPYRRASAAIAIVRGDRTEALRLLKRGPRLRYPFQRQRDQRTHAMVVSEAQRLAS